MSDKLLKLSATLVQLGHDEASNLVLSLYDDSSILTSTAMARSADPELESLRKLITDSDERLHLKFKDSPVTSSDIHADVLLNDNVDIHKQLNDRNVRNGRKTFPFRRTKQQISQWRTWGQQYGMSDDPSRVKRKRNRDIHKRINNIIESGGSVAEEYQALSNEYGMSAQSLIVIAYGHTIDTPFGQLADLIKSRDPQLTVISKIGGKVRHPFRDRIIDVLKNLSSFLGSMTELEVAAYPQLRAAISVEELGIKGRGGIPAIKEVAGTYAMLNASRGSQSRHQAASLGRIIKNMILEDLVGTSTLSPTPHSSAKGCGNQVPGLNGVSFKDLYESTHITNDFLYTKLSIYIEDCFGVIKKPDTIEAWAKKIGIHNSKRSLSRPRWKSCSDMSSIINKIICNETSFRLSSKVKIEEVKFIYRDVYSIIDSDLKSNNINIRCSPSTLAQKVRSCSIKSLSKYENLSQYSDVETERMYSILQSVIDDASPGVSSGVISKIKDYFIEYAAYPASQYADVLRKPDLPEGLGEGSSQGDDAGAGELSQK